MRKMLLPVAAALGLLAGCYTQGDVGVGYSYGYAAPAPSLYYVSPGVSVVAYSDVPVFYADNYYWRYDSGLWYRSNYYGGGWVVWNDVPYGVRSIDRPYRYARYQPGRWSRPASSQGGVYVRDHRGSTPAYRGRYQAPPASRQPAQTYRAPAPTYRAPAPTYRAPATRDHRTYSPAPARSAPTVRDHRR